MGGPVDWRAGRAVAACLALTAAACSGAGASSESGGSPRAGHGHGGSPRPRGRDTFRARIVSATGAYAGDSGAASVYLYPGLRRGAGPRPLRLVIRGVPCHGARKCLDLNGTLHGTLIRSPRLIPDTGTHYALAGHGALAPLGRTTASGSVQGTGFIRRAEELMQLTLTGSSGSVTVRAQSQTVKGFTSP